MRQPPPELVRHLADRLSPLGEIAAARFFGGWQLSLHGRPVLYLLRDRLWLPCDAALREALIAEGSEPFRYEKSGREITVERFHELPPEALDDDEALLRWVSRAVG